MFFVTWVYPSVILLCRIHWFDNFTLKPKSCLISKTLKSKFQRWYTKWICMNVYVCMYIFTHICVCIYMCVHFAHTYVYMHKYVCTTYTTFFHDGHSNVWMHSVPFLRTSCPSWTSWTRLHSYQSIGDLPWLSRSPSFGGHTAIFTWPFQNASLRAEGDTAVGLCSLYSMFFYLEQPDFIDSDEISSKCWYLRSCCQIEPHIF